MAETYSDETDGKLDASGRAQLDSHVYRADLKRIRATIPYDGQADGDTIVLGELPPGAVFSHGTIVASATFGATATLAIGVAGAAEKFRAAATVTNTTFPVTFGLAAASAADPSNTPERIIATVGAAAAPDSSAFMVVDIFYSGDAG